MLRTCLSISRRTTWLLAALMLLGSVGCRPRSQQEQGDKEFVLGDMIEEFTPPSWEELEALEWVDQPVLSATERLRDELAEQEGEPIPVEEALELKNDSEEANEKIWRSLGQLAPQDGKGVDYEARILRHVGGDLKSANPLKASSVTEFEYGSHTGFGYMSFDRHFQLFAPEETVESWQRSADKLRDKIVLRDDLTWSDGTPITAHDIEFTFKVIMSSQVPIPAVRSGTEELAYVKAYDDHTVVFFHKEALATNTQNILFVPIPKHVYEKSIYEDPTLEQSDHHRQYENNPVTGGAYEMVRRVRNREFILRRRESYFMHEGKQVRPKPHFAEIRCKAIEDPHTALVAMKAGDLEEMILRPEQWVDQTSGSDFYDRNTKATALEWTSFHFNWNQKSALFEDKRVRWAMTYAMDYQELLDTICYGIYQPNQGTFHPTSWMFPENGPEPVQQDLEKAKQLLDEAGWSDSDHDGIRDKVFEGRKTNFEFTLHCNSTDTSIKVCTLMKECLDQIGIVCNVRPTEFTALQDITQKKKFQAAFGGWGTGADPDTSSNLFATPADRNFGSHSDPRVDELFELGRREFDREKRAKIYAEIHTRLWEEQPYTWLFYRNGFYAYNKKLRGYNYSPRGPFGYSPGFESLYVPAATP